LPTRLWRPSWSLYPSTLVSQVLLLASKICLYLDVWDLIMLSREKFILSPFINSGRRFGWLRPVNFPLTLRGFPPKNDWCPFVLICYCYTYALRAYRACPTYLKKSTICVVRSPRTCPSLGQNMFLYISLMHIFFFRNWAL
jgi:hypothetical protein